MDLKDEKIYFYFESDQCKSPGAALNNVRFA